MISAFADAYFGPPNDINLSVVSLNTGIDPFHKSKLGCYSAGVIWIDPVSGIKGRTRPRARGQGVRPVQVVSHLLPLASNRPDRFVFVVGTRGGFTDNTLNSTDRLIDVVFRVGQLHVAMTYLPVTARQSG